MAEIEKELEPYPKAAVFELGEEGFSSLFEALVACMISIRTRDEVTRPTARKLFARARTPQDLAGMSVPEISLLIQDCAFHERKAHQIRRIAQTILGEHGGALPAERDLLLSFPGVGPKCANLALAVSGHADLISVDIHVHRITNRWGYVQTRSPEVTLAVLEEKLPRRHWVDINRLLVPFGKFVCRGRYPKCSSCPVLQMCQQVGVEGAG